jgi:hypothetical protein
VIHIDAASSVSPIATRETDAGSIHSQRDTTNREVRMTDARAPEAPRLNQSIEATTGEVEATVQEYLATLVLGQPVPEALRERAAGYMSSADLATKVERILKRLTREAA